MNERQERIDALLADFEEEARMIADTKKATKKAVMQFQQLMKKIDARRELQDLGRMLSGALTALKKCDGRLGIVGKPFDPEIVRAVERARDEARRRLKPTDARRLGKGGRPRKLPACAERCIDELVKLEMTRTTATRLVKKRYHRLLLHLQLPDRSDAQAEK